MSSSATGVGMPICFLWDILLILTQKSSQKFGDVLGIMVLDLRLTRLGLSGAPFFMSTCLILTIHLIQISMQQIQTYPY